MKNHIQLNNMTRQEIKEFDFHALLKAGYNNHRINEILMDYWGSYINYELLLTLSINSINTVFKKDMLKAYREQIEHDQKLNKIYESYIGSFEHQLFHYKQGLIGKFKNKADAEQMMKEIGGVFQWDDPNFEHLIVY